MKRITVTNMQFTIKERKHIKNGLFDKTCTKSLTTTFNL